MTFTGKYVVDDFGQNYEMCFDKAPMSIAVATLPDANGINRTPVCRKRKWHTGEHQCGEMRWGKPVKTRTIAATRNEPPGQRGWSKPLPDTNCITTGDGGCESTKPCMHTPIVCESCLEHAFENEKLRILLAKASELLWDSYTPGSASLAFTIHNTLYPKGPPHDQSGNTKTP